MQRSFAAGKSTEEFYFSVFAFTFIHYFSDLFDRAVANLKYQAEVKKRAECQVIITTPLVQQWIRL